MALVACMCKLLTILNAMVKQGTSWQPVAAADPYPTILVHHRRLPGQRYALYALWWTP